jgi:HEAT repeat protein
MEVPEQPSFADYLKSLADESKKLSITGLRHLSGLTSLRVAELESVWRGLTVERRRQIVQSAAELAEDNVEMDFAALFKLALADPDEDVRATAVDGLWEDEESSTALRLLDLLAKDASPRVRASAASILAHFVYRIELGEITSSTARKVREGLLAVVHGPAEPVEVKRRAIEAVAYLSEPEVHDIIARAYADSDEKMRASAVFAMGRNCDPVWLDTIVAEMKNANPEIRYEAARAAGELEDQRAVRPMVSLLVDNDREVRLATITALGQIGGTVARKALEYTTEHGDEETRTAATEALEQVSFAEDPLGLPRVAE